MSDAWCTQDCVGMGLEIDRLKKENLGLRDLVKRLADKLESEAERPYLVESLIREARESNKVLDEVDRLMNENKKLKERK